MKINKFLLSAALVSTLGITQISLASPGDTPSCLSPLSLLGVYQLQPSDVIPYTIAPYYNYMGIVHANNFWASFGANVKADSAFDAFLKIQDVLKTFGSMPTPTAKWDGAHWSCYYTNMGNPAGMYFITNGVM